MSWFQRTLFGRGSRPGSTRAGLLALGVLGLASAGLVYGGGDELREGGDSATVEAVEAVEGTSEATTAEVRAGMNTDEWDLPNLSHSRVDYWVDRFVTDADMREKFEGFLRRAGLYQEMISRKLAARDMPQDLIFLAMIESGFQSRAYSPAHASGLWQFIPETGRRYGLRVDAQVDERNHPEKATDAALDYLTYLHDRFGSWYLASAAYNTGENRVGRIMRSQTGSEKARSEEDYYMIWSRLPRETRDYVPLMIAAGRIAKDPARYGFDHVEPLTRGATEQVVTDAELTLRQAAAAAGVPVEDIRELNPHVKGDRLPRGERYVLTLPSGTRDIFMESWADHAPDGGVERSYYTVRRGDNLTVIAQRHGVSVNEIRSANSLRGDRIYAGQTLTIAGR